MSFICIVDNLQTIQYKQIQEIEGKNCSEILKSLNFFPDFDLYYSSPLYAEKIPESDNPTELFPELEMHDRISKYSFPQYYLMILPKKTNQVLFLSIKINVPNMCEIPPIRMEFIVDTFETGSDVLSFINKNFELEHTDGGTDSFNSDDQADIIFDNAKKNMIEFNCTLTEKAMKYVKNREDIVSEILRTEKSYVSDLFEILNYFKPKIERANVFTESQFTQIFTDFPAILSCHSLFLQKLIERGSSYATTLSDLFLEFCDYFKVSLPFITHYGALIQIIHPKALSNMSLFTHKKNGIPFSSYLIEPIQRLPRYLLFLKVLIKNTPKTHPDYHYLEQALNKILKVTSDIDTATKNAQSINEIWSLQLRLSKPYNLINPSRTMKYQCNVKISGETYKLYLFNDLIIINSVDKDKETVVYDFDLLNFSYFPYFNSFSFYNKKQKSKKVKFKNSTVFLSFLNNLEQLRYDLYKSNNNYHFLFTWSNPVVMTELPKSPETYSAMYQDNLYFLTNLKLITVNIQKKVIHVQEAKYLQRSKYSISNYGNDIYLIGGVNNKEYFNNILKINPVLNKAVEIQATNNIFKPRCEHTSIIYNNKIYIFGGRYKTKYYNSFYEYDIALNKWRKIPRQVNTPSPRSQHSAVLFQNKMVIIGGKNGETVFNTICIFDFINYNWETIQNNEIPKLYGHSSFNLFDVYIITIGGRNNIDSKIKNCFIIKCKKDFQFIQNQNGGNVPDLIYDFGLCYDFKGNSFVAFFNGSLFIIKLPERLESYSKDFKDSFCDSKNNLINMKSRSLSTHSKIEKNHSRNESLILVQHKNSSEKKYSDRLNYNETYSKILKDYSIRKVKRTNSQIISCGKIYKEQSLKERSRSFNKPNISLNLNMVKKRQIQLKSMIPILRSYESLAVDKQKYFEKRTHFSTNRLRSMKIEIKSNPKNIEILDEKQKYVSNNKELTAFPRKKPKFSINHKNRDALRLDVSKISTNDNPCKSLNSKEIYVSTMIKDDKPNTNTTPVPSFNINNDIIKLEPKLNVIIHTRRKPFEYDLEDDKPSENTQKKNSEFKKANNPQKNPFSCLSPTLAYKVHQMTLSNMSDNCNQVIKTIQYDSYIAGKFHFTHPRIPTLKTPNIEEMLFSKYNINVLDLNEFQKRIIYLKLVQLNNIINKVNIISDQLANAIENEKQLKKEKPLFLKCYFNNKIKILQLNKCIDYENFMSFLHESFPTFSSFSIEYNLIKLKITESLFKDCLSNNEISHLNVFIK